MPRRVSLKDIAERAGVSYQTVSKVLMGRAHAAPETAERIRQVAEELGYRPNYTARNLRMQRSLMIGYSWVPTSPNQVNHILDTFLTSMVQEAEAKGYHLLPFPFREGEALVDAYRELIDTGRVDGFILSSVNYNDPRIAFLLQRGFPFVAFGRSNPELDFPYVDVDGGEGLRAAVEYLISKGHRRIAALAWPEESRVGNDRLRGYFSALQAAGLRAEPEWIARGEGTFESGHEIVSRWLAARSNEMPRAIIALNDTQAIGAIHAIQERGLEAGRDIDVIGFDDAPMSQYLRPPLTTIRQPIREAGRLCVNMLVCLIEGGQPEETHILLPPKLILRASA